MEINEMHPEHEHATASMKVVLLVFAIVLIGALSYLVWAQKDVATETTDNSTTKLAAVFKTVSRGGDFTFSVPNTWSVYLGRDDEVPTDSLSFPLLSVGSKDVSQSDINWTQVDFSFSQGDIAARLVAEAKAKNSIGWTQEKVGGVTADVYTDPLDNNEVTKDGTGGKTYYLSLADKNVTGLPVENDRHDLFVVVGRCGVMTKNDIKKHPFVSSIVEVDKPYKLSAKSALNQTTKIKITDKQVR